MTAITVSFTTKVVTDWDPDKPLSTTKLNALYDNTEFNSQWLGASYKAGAVQDHDHDGLNSALVPIGANYLRNGSFESGTNGWAITQYTGGTVAVSTSVPLDGAQSLAFTSTILANGGGDAVSNEYIPCKGGESRPIISVLSASVANLSAKIEILWYDNAKTQISATAFYSTASAPTLATIISAITQAPANARWMRTKMTGGVPGVGTSVGTIYMDGVVAGSELIGVPVIAGTDYVSMANTLMADVGPYLATAEAANARVLQSGVYRVRALLKTTNSGGTAHYQVYKNGVAVGVDHSTSSTAYVEFTDDLILVDGDTVQIMAWNSVVNTTYIKEFSFGITKNMTKIVAAPAPIFIGER